MRTEQQTINVIFDAGKGTVTVLSREASVGKAIGALPVPSRSGFSFEGWYLEGELITENFVIESDDDIRLIAGWAKKTGVKRNSVLKRQKIAILCMAILIVLLSVSLAIVNDLFSVKTIEDIYFNENGEKVTQTYYVKKVNGIYGLYDEDDVRMQINTEGYHIALSGNQYSINEETGECKLYALVDAFDQSIGELLGFDARVMMFEQISPESIYSIHVSNKGEDYTILRHPNGSVYIKGTENRLNVLNDNIFASLAVSCGYTLTIGKLDLNSPEAPRNEDGSIDYSAYGLGASDNPLVYTITKRDYTEDGLTCAATGAGSSYTVYVGNATLSDTGYYARLEGRDAVYILSPTVTPTLTKPVEAMVTASAIYPMNVTTHLMVKNFLLEEANVTVSNAYDFLKGGSLKTNSTTHVVDFSYQDILERENTMYALHPFVTSTKLMEGYFLDTNNISNALTLLYKMLPSECIELGLTEESLKEYIFGGNDAADIHHLTFRYNVVERSPFIKRLPRETQEEFEKRCYDYAKDMLKDYGVTEVDDNTSLATMLRSLEMLGVYLEDGALYDKLTHLQEIYAYCSGVLIDLGYTMPKLSETENTNITILENKVDEVVKKLKDLGTGIYMDDETMDMYVVNELLISAPKDGVYYIASTLYNMIVEVDAYNLAFLNWNSKNWYSQFINWVEIPSVTDIQIITQNKEFIFSLDNSKSDQSEGPNSEKLDVYVGTGSNKQLLDYGAGIQHTYVSDTGMVVTEYVDALTNFRAFYEVFEFISLDGIIDEAELKKMQAAGMTPEGCLALPDSECDMIMYYRAVDWAGNSIAKVIRFYTYSGHSFVTIEVVNAFDQNGNPTNDWKSQSNPANAKGMFYVDAKYLARIIDNADRVVSKELVDILENQK